MPNLPSGYKRMRSDAVRRARNQSAQNRLKSLYKSLVELGQEKKSKEAAELAKILVGDFDRAASNGSITKNTASRKKARIAALLSKISK